MISYESLGLTTRANKEALKATLVSSYSLRIDVLVLSLEGDRLGDLSSKLIDGQVTVDETADITRTATLTLFDPKNTIAFDSDSPKDAAVYLNNMIQIRYCVKGPLLTDWVEIPIFTGPITSLSRDDSTVAIECKGKELLAMGSSWQVFNRPKGAYIVDVIKDIMNNRAGENRFDFPEDAKGRLDKPFSMSRESTPWLAARKLAQSINRQLFYDGRGVLTLRPQSQNNPQWTFDVEKDVLSVPTLAFTSDDIKNVVVVHGGAPKKEDKKIEATAMPVASHPLSPSKLGRNGVGRYLVENISNGQIRSAKAAQELAEDRLARLLRQHVEVAFEAVPIPMLEEGDAVELQTDDYKIEFNASQFTIPLVAGGSMNMGFLDRNNFARNRFRTRSRWIKPPKKKQHKGKGKDKHHGKNNNKNND